jgi:uncharacterized protein YqfA (UPF0365 family)
MIGIGSIVGIFVIGFFALIIVTTFIPIPLYIAAKFSGVRIGMFDLIGMKLRKVDPSEIVNPLIMATKGSIPHIGAKALEGLFLSGGNVSRVVSALIAANKAGITLDFETAKAIDLAGRDVLEAVRMSVNPKIIRTPLVGAVAKDGIEIKVISTVTVKTNIDKLVGGAGEDTIMARVGEGICTCIGKSATHKLILENPDHISRTVLENGLDKGTAFRILSINIADIDVGANIGAKLQIDEAEASKDIAEARAEERKAMAEARIQEMKALEQEMKAKVLDAQTKVPMAISDALKCGKMSALEYYKLQNVIADTEMREAISNN